MKISQLQLFKTIAENEHLTKTSNQLHIAQPALSKTIKELEMELDVPLFDRIGQGIRLNENGKILLKYTNHILADLDNIKLEIDEYNKKNKCTITLSVQIATQLIPEFISHFHSRYPNYKVTFTQESEADFILFASTSPEKSNNSMTLFKENLVLAIPINHPLANQHDVSLLSFKNDNFISYIKSFSKSKSLGELTTEYCQIAGFSPNIVLESDNPSIVRQLVEQGLGISLIPEFTWKNINHERIKLLNITDPICIRYFNLSWDEQKYQSKIQLLFKQQLIEFFKH